MQQMNYRHPERGRPGKRPTRLANALMIVLIVAVVAGLVALAAKPLLY